VSRIHIPLPRSTLWALAALAAALLLAWLSGISGIVQIFDAPQEVVLLALLAALAALHRPVARASLGLGCLALPLGLERLGAAPTALAAAAAWLLAEAGRGLWLRTEPRSLGRRLETAAAVAAALLAAAAAGELGAEPWQRYALAALVYVVVFAGWGLAAATWRGPQSLVERVPAVFFDLAGWALGALVSTEAGSGPGTWLLLATSALLAAEAARNAAHKVASEQRIDDYKRVHRAHHRILAETSEMALIAEQVLAECRNVLPVAWFQLEMMSGPEAGKSWSSGPEGAIFEGLPQPPPTPPALPGIHRRTSWKVFEKPLEAEGEILAELRLWCDPRQIEPGGEELLATLLPQMASSLHRSRLDREAKLDPLTGVPLRRVLERRLAEAYRRSCEDGRSMAVVMCDIDHFKRINDTWGHDAGDEALVAVAQTLDTERRERDLCCRYGGEEFTLLLEDTPGLQALRLAERLRREIEALEFHYEGERIDLRLSLGVAAFPELQVRNGKALLNLADEALYRAKESGRNRALLNQGHGRFRDVYGRTTEAEKAPPPVEPPRILG